MDQLSFGTVLRSARERKGYDLGAAARRLRIRPDILAAIEASDFSRMPPRGYARNMVNAYARYLGLNPTEVTRMYLDECYAYQVGRARSDARSTGFDMSGAPGSRRRGYDDDHEGSSALGRKLYVDDPHRDRRRDEAAIVDRGGRLDERTHRSNRSALPGTQYTNFYSGPKASPLSNSKLPFIIAGVVILVLLIVILVLVFGPKGDGQEDVPKVPVSGLTDPEVTQGEGEGEADTPAPAPAQVAPTKAVFKFEVLAGQAAYVEIYPDGTGPTVAQDFESGYSQEIDVTGTLSFHTTNPSAVKTYIDGVEVTPEDKTGYGIVYVVDVDFPAILAAWQAEHPAAGAAASGTGAAAGTTAGTTTPPAE